MKRALLIGINYIGTPYKLNGCINDVINVRRMLTYHFDYKKENIITLTDDTSLKPTRDNIINSMKSLINQTKPDDTLFVHYSGHGYFTYNYNTNGVNDEEDGKDEFICPLDNNPILDDELYNILVRNFTPGAKLRALFDCCHSGTVLDLPCNIDIYNKFTIQSNIKKKYSDIIMISGCRDNQTSTDAYITDKYRGALTWAFIYVLQEYINTDNKLDVQLDWRDFITIIRYELKKNDYTQIPQLSFMFKEQVDDIVEI